MSSQDLEKMLSPRRSSIFKKTSAIESESAKKVSAIDKKFIRASYINNKKNFSWRDILDKEIVNKVDESFAKGGNIYDEERLFKEFKKNRRNLPME